MPCFFCFLFFHGGRKLNRQLPVSAAIDVAEMLEHQSEPGAQSALSRTRPAQVLATRNHGGGDLQRVERRIVLESSSKVTIYVSSSRWSRVREILFTVVRFPLPSGHQRNQISRVNQIKNGVASLLNQMGGPNYICIRRSLCSLEESGEKNFIIRRIFVARRDKLN